MRIWRNWQTRRFQVPVGDRAGSTPVIRTNKKEDSFCCPLFCWYEFRVLTGVEGGGASESEQFACGKDIRAKVCTQTEQWSPTVHRGAPPKAQLLLRQV